MRYALLYPALAFFSLSGLTAQLPPGMGGMGTGTSPGTAAGAIGPGGSAPSQPKQGDIPGQSSGGNQMPILLSGRVLMEDSTPPLTSIAIKRECSGVPRTVAFTNPKGQFSFQWDNFAGVLPDASEVGPGSSNLDGVPGLRGGSLGNAAGSRSMVGCDLIASAAGFRSERLDLSGHRSGDSPDLGTIVLHRIAGVEGTSVSATALSAPKNARKAWEKGVELLHKSKNAEAEKELEKAVGIYPKYANAWLDLGRARMRLQAEGTAREAFLKAIEADGKLVDPYIKLGELAAGQKNWPDAAQYLDHALDLDHVDYPRLWFEDAIADYNVQKFDRAEKNARAALKLSPPQFDARANQLLGLILIGKQDYAGASEALHAYLRLSADAKDAGEVKAQLDQIDSRLGTAK
jgi:tetratricopeptide (TPR) repeat protein